MKEWLDNKDAESAKAVLQKTITELREMNLPYEFSRITATLSGLIDEIDTEARARKTEWVSAVETVIRERTPILG